MKNSIKKAMYAGSFDPFTNGHLDIVKEAAELFDQIFICIAKNPNKQRKTDALVMANAIEQTLKENNIDNAIVVIHVGLVADFCAQNNIKYLVRGLRNTSDYMYEENIAKINAEVNPNLKTVYFRAKNDIISSSMVRELYSFDRDVSQYIPPDIARILS